MTWLEIWHWLTTRRYTRALEGEVERLRAENRALMNSILGVAGVPPLRFPEAPGFEHARVAPGSPGLRSSALRAAAMNAQPGTSVAPGKAAKPNGFLPALRRRSWQQIGRMLELAEARLAREKSPH